MSPTGVSRTSRATLRFKVHLHCRKASLAWTSGSLSFGPRKQRSDFIVVRHGGHHARAPAWSATAHLPSGHTVAMPTAFEPAVALASSVHAAPGTFALLVGSGISRAAQVPTGWDVVVALARRVALLEGGEDPEDPLAWYSERFGGDPDYSASLAQLAPTPAERRNLLEGFFTASSEEREQGIKTPTRAHRAIAELVSLGYIRVIVTTNFDRLLEEALVEAGIQPVVITNEQSASGAIPLAHSRCTVIKVHGDYLDPDLKNTAEELGSYAPAVDALVDQVFDQYGLIICGWSAEWDEALRNALLRAPSRRYGTYWTHRGLPGEWAQRLIAHRQAVQVSIAGADEFFESLTARVTALAEALDQRPLSTALAVAELKRYLPDPRYRIRLHDLFMNEVARVVQRAPVDTNQSPPTPELFAERLRTDEAAMSILLALLVHAGYFADQPEHDDLLIRVLRRLASGRTNQGGYQIWISVQQYPAMLGVYALGLGALAAQRPTPLALALATVRVQRMGREEPLGQAIASWSVLDEGAVRQLPDLAKRKTPISDYLHDRLRDFARPVLPDDHEYDEVFDQLEYLLGVVSAHARGHGIGPIGRFIWGQRPNDKPIPDEPFTTHAAAFLSAGLFDGQQETLDTTKAAYDERITGSQLRY